MVAVLLLFEPRVGEPGDVATTLVGGLLFESGGGHRWQTYSPFSCCGIGDKHSQQMQPRRLGALVVVPLRVDNEEAVVLLSFTNDEEVVVLELEAAVVLSSFMDDEEVVVVLEPEAAVVSSSGVGATK